MLVGETRLASADHGRAVVDAKVVNAKVVAADGRRCSNGMPATDADVQIPLALCAQRNGAQRRLRCFAQVTGRGSSAPQN